MNEHDALEPTIAMPRIETSPIGAAPSYPPAQPIPPEAVLRQAQMPSPVAAARAPYVFGNPLIYALRRFLAFVLDFVVVSSVATMLVYGLIAINPLTGLPNNSEGGFDTTVGIGVAIAVIYLWLFEALFGTTLGKLAFSLHVYAPRRLRFVGLGRSLIRNILRPIDLIVIGAILAMAPGHRRLGDLLGGTVVAHSPLRAFSPLVGWLLIAGLVAVPFFVAGGTTTIFAVATAFIEFIPPLLRHAVDVVLGLFGASATHVPLPTATG